MRNPNFLIKYVSAIQVSHAHISIQPNLKKIRKKKNASEKNREIDNEGQESSRRFFIPNF
jgi:hypothetical protein